EFRRVLFRSFCVRVDGGRFAQEQRDVLAVIFALDVALRQFAFRDGRFRFGADAGDDDRFRHRRCEDDVDVIAGGDAADVFVKAAARDGQRVFAIGDIEREGAAFVGDVVGAVDGNG